MMSFTFLLALAFGSGGNIDIVGTGNHQIVLFFVILCGAIVGLICSFVNIFSKTCDSKIISFIIDLCMTLGCLLIYFVVVYNVDCGVIRVYSVLGYSLSLLLVRYYIEKLILLTKDRIIAEIKKAYRYLYKKLKIAEKNAKKENIKRIRCEKALKRKKTKKAEHLALKAKKNKENNIKRNKAKELSKENNIKRNKARELSKENKIKRNKLKELLKGKNKSKNLPKKVKNKINIDKNDYTITNESKSKHVKSKDK